MKKHFPACVEYERTQACARAHTRTVTALSMISIDRADARCVSAAECRCLSAAQVTPVILRSCESCGFHPGTDSAAAI